MSVRHVSLVLSSETYPSLSGRWINKDTDSSRLLQLGPGVCAKESHRQVATGSEPCIASDHRDPETRAWSFTAVAWWSALADYSTAGAVQACRDCFIGVFSTKLQRTPPTAACQFPKFPVANISVRPAVANWIFHGFSQHIWHPGFSSRQSDGLELTAWFVARSGRRVWTR